MRAHAAVAILLLCLGPLARTAQSGSIWPRFRGPNGEGIAEAPGLPTRWTEADYDWRVELPAIGHSSPVVWGDRIFVTAGDSKNATRYVLCIRGADGSVLWTRRYDSKPHRLNRDNSYATSTPALDAQRAYVYWATPREVTLLALRHDGREAWRRDLGPFDSQHGSGVSPIVHDGLVIVPNDQKGESSLIALDCQSGATRWKVPRKGGKAAYATPCVYRPQGGPPELIFFSTEQGITSVDPRSGEVNWQFASAFPLRVVASPVVASGLIVGTCGVGGSGRRFVAVRPGPKPELVYEFRRRVPYVPTPVTRGDLLFLCTDSGTATCLRAPTGEVVWQESLGEKFYGSFVRVGDRLYIMSRKGSVYVLAASEKFELLAKNPLGEGSFATPVVVDGKMFLRTFSHLMSIGSKQ
ncbi:MAG: PQQ-binding-like beta-propeller repeat protein [Candidatus Brocadiia bacterium]